MPLKQLFFRLFTFLLLTTAFAGYSQEDETIDLGSLNLSETQEEKISAAFAALDAVQLVNSYIESLSDLFTNGELTLPVGIKKGDYELIIQKVSLEDPGNPHIYATCAFWFKDTGQKIAFEGYYFIKKAFSAMDMTVF
jgi:hypothetical protein